MNTPRPGTTKGEVMKKKTIRYLILADEKPIYFEGASFFFAASGHPAKVFSSHHSAVVAIIEHETDRKMRGFQVVFKFRVQSIR